MKKKTYAFIIFRINNEHVLYRIGPFKDTDETTEWCDTFRHVTCDMHDDITAYPETVVQPTSTDSIKTLPHRKAEHILEEIWHEQHPLS